MYWNSTTRSIFKKSKVTFAHNTWFLLSKKKQISMRFVIFSVHLDAVSVLEEFFDGIFLI